MSKIYRGLRIKKNEAGGELHESGYHYIRIEGETLDWQVEFIADKCDAINLPKLFESNPYSNQEQYWFGDFTLDIPANADYIHIFSHKYNFIPIEPICSDALFKLILKE